MSRRFETELERMTFAEIREKAVRAIESHKNLFWIPIYNRIGEIISEEQNPYKQKFYGKSIHD